MESSNRKKKNMTVCYFGNYDPEFSRNKIYVYGLKKKGVNVIECRTKNGGFLKYIDLFVSHWKIRNKYDFLIVGYPDRVSVLLARLISRRPVIFNALCSMYEIVVISRKQFAKDSIKALLYKFLDTIAVKAAHIVLVETESQKKYFIENFGATLDNCFKLYTGVDNSVFYFNEHFKKTDTFTALFRGRFIPEAGVKYIIEAAKILENQSINFLLLGGGPSSKIIKNIINKLSPKNLVLVEGYLSSDDLRHKMLSSHVSLGQFENNERLKRTIPHKAAESLAMKLPYITGRAEGISELLTDGQNCLMVNLADPNDLADKILKIKNNPEIAKKITENGYLLYQEKLTPEILVDELLEIIERFVNNSK